jgi:branched-chain amino acid transport system permease protein
MSHPSTPRLVSRLAPSVLLLIVLLGIVLLVNAFATPYLARVVLLLGINIILVVSLNLSNGFTGVFSLGHVGFMAIGAYVSSILTLTLETKAQNLPDLPAWLAHVQIGLLPAMLIGALVAGIIALLIGLPLMRLSGHYVSVATLGFLVIVHIVLVNWTQFTRGARTFSGVPAHTTIWWVYAWLVITIYAVWRLVHSPYGRAMLAVRENEIAAQAVGVNVLRSRILAFVVSAFLTAIGGALWAHMMTSFSPASFYFTQTFNIVIMLVVGGVGSISGSVLGTVLVMLLSEALRNAELGIQLGPLRLPPLYGLAQIVLAAAFILVVFFSRKGLMGDREIDIRRLFLRGTGARDRERRDDAQRRPGKPDDQRDSTTHQKEEGK